MDRPDVAIEQLAALRRSGLRISLDDFGTGYCSLAYLTRFPIDTLKIDARFVADLPGDHRAAAIARSVIALGQQLELVIVAEGVETQGQLEFLRQQGCAHMQGFVFSPAVPADALQELATRRHPGPTQGV
jgi:EAL domain-containing protein (putative c-di-GMP-specific phosphodiesterase class I)